MATAFDLDLQVQLRPIWHDDPPVLTISCHDHNHTISLDQSRTISFSFASTGTQQLSIEFINKKDSDNIPEKGLDKAIIIEKISFFGIHDPRFIWLGRYRPTYPEPWASEQRELGNVLVPVLTNVDRLSWNGTWTLDFDLPVFTWIHQQQNLGWIHR